MALRDAAKLVYEGHTGRMKLAPARRSLGDDIEFLCHWSRRWLDAEKEIDKAKAKQIAAYSAHLDRVKSLEELCQKGAKGGEVAKYELAMAQYFRIEAEQWQAAAKGR